MDMERLNLILDAAFSSPNLTTAAAAADAVEEMFGDKDSVMWLVYELKAMVRKGLLMESLTHDDPCVEILLDRSDRKATILYRGVQLRQRSVASGEVTSEHGTLGLTASRVAFPDRELEIVQREMEFYIRIRTPLIINDIRRLIA